MLKALCCRKAAVDEAIVLLFSVTQASSCTFAWHEQQTRTARVAPNTCKLQQSGPQSGPCWLAQPGRLK